MIYRFRRRLWTAVRTICVLVTIFLCVVTFTPFVPAVAGRIATDWYDGNGDVLVVLGGSMLLSGTGPRASLGYDSYLRVVYASWVLQEHRFPWVVVSGGSGLAQEMGNFLAGNGFPRASILEETRSESTFENAIYVKDLLQRRNMLSPSRKVVILTSDLHSWRARRVFDKQGMHVRVIPVPDVTKRSGSRIYRWEGFFVLLNEFGKDVAYAVMGRL
jgi:uncharacterized SAM-binding protein YcdF (DUF218 family)